MENQQDYIRETELRGVYVINRPVYNDERGFFREIFRKADLEACSGLHLDFIQANHSHSARGVLRGVHIAPWHKLVTVPNGEVQQVVVDCNPASSTFGKYVSVNLNQTNAIFLPAGFGNAYSVLSESADYMYLVTEYWAPNREKYLLYNDPDVNIEWQDKNPLVNERDLKGIALREMFPEKFKF